eukprot:TRINITY_DN12282_c0_g1_i1.p1 TRINITY_DN12282_c0_g1~~TRINITY_DN12282_c0_g1_i1.p1  ORF type:complete len:101 (+),score=6.28 TRINITY_DN12282_c0_g1_i1:474-776(+)
MTNDSSNTSSSARTHMYKSSAPHMTPDWRASAGRSATAPSTLRCAAVADAKSSRRQFHALTSRAGSTVVAKIKRRQGKDHLGRRHLQSPTEHSGPGGGRN